MNFAKCGTVSNGLIQEAAGIAALAIVGVYCGISIRSALEGPEDVLIRKARNEGVRMSSDISKYLVARATKEMESSIKSEMAADLLREQSEAKAAAEKAKAELEALAAKAKA